MDEDEKSTLDEDSGSKELLNTIDDSPDSDPVELLPQAMKTLQISNVEVSFRIFIIVSLRLIVTLHFVLDFAVLFNISLIFFMFLYK